MPKQIVTGEDPATSNYGWPYDRRIAFLDEAAKSSKATHRVVFMGENWDLPIISVPIQLPKYRLLNGRTASAQQEYLATHADVPKDFFEADPERIDVQEVQHALLADMLKVAGLKQKFDDPSKSQVEPLILDESGYVVNGNRRLCTWRNLYYGDRAKWGRYSHVDVVVLPHADPEEIDRLENALQVEKDIRADFTWDSLANTLLRRQQRFNLKDEELAARENMKVGEIRTLLDMRKYAEEYLRSRGKENRWSFVSGDELAFRALAEKRATLRDANSGEKDLFKEAAFAVIENPGEVQDSSHDAIRNLQRYLQPIKEEFAQAFPVVASRTGGDRLFGGTTLQSSDLALATQIAKPENAKRTREIIRDIIKTRKELEKDEQSAAYLLKLLGKANGAFETAIAHALKPESIKTGVEGQLRAIEAKIATIPPMVEQWLGLATGPATVEPLLPGIHPMMTFAGWEFFGEPY
jgi:hypothetical protein